MSVQMNYDPNLTNSGRMAQQTVRLTFGQWTYRHVIDVVVGGNCTGLTVIDCAIENAYERLDPPSQIEMCDHSTGTTMLVTDDEDREDEWLKDMLVSAEIIEIQPKKGAHHD